MKSLFELILEENNHFCIKTKEQKIDKICLKNLHDKNQAKLKSLKNANVNIKISNNCDLAKLLILLESKVNLLAFFPEDLPQTYLKKAKITHLVYLKDEILQIEKIADEEIKINKNTSWIIPTSGTTKEPKLINHSLETLSKSLKNDYEKGSFFTYGLCYDLHRFSGLQVFLQAIFGGSTLLLGGENLEENLHFFAQNDCNIISATPSFFRKILMSENKLNLKRITLGGEIVDQRIINELKKSFKNAKITHIYASTEAGACFSVKDEKEGFGVDYLQKYNLSIKNGTLWVNSLNTHDLVEAKNDRVYFLGRDSGAINVGGNKVQAETVEKILNEHENVKFAKVYAKKSPILGSLVCAEVVFENEHEKAKADLLAHCKTRLNKYQIPAIIKAIKQIDINSNGKIKRN